MWFVLLIMEEIVEVINALRWERFSERICEQIVDVNVSQIVEQVTEVAKTPSRDRTLQCTVEQILDVPRTGNGETVGGSAEDRFRGQNPTADCGAYRWHSSSAGCEGTGGGLEGFHPRTEFNSVPEDRSSTPLLFLSLRSSLRYLSFKTPETQMIQGTQNL